MVPSSVTVSSHEYPMERCLLEEHHLGLHVAIVVTLTTRAVQVQARGQVISLHVALCFPPVEPRRHRCVGLGECEGAYCTGVNQNPTFTVRRAAHERRKPQDPPSIATTDTVEWTLVTDELCLETLPANPPTSEASPRTAQRWQTHAHVRLHPLAPRRATPNHAQTLLPRRTAAWLGCGLVPQHIAARRRGWTRRQTRRWQHVPRG